MRLCPDCHAETKSTVWTDELGYTWVTYTCSCGWRLTIR